MEEHGILLPAQPPKKGTIKVERLRNHRFRFVGYAVLVRKGGLQKELLENFGRSLGMLAASDNFLKISMPLVGNSAVGISPQQAAKALKREFTETAPSNATLNLTTRNWGTVAEVLADGQSGEERIAYTEGWQIKKPNVKRVEKQGFVWPTISGLKEREPAPAPSDQSFIHNVPSFPAPILERSRIFISYSHADRKWLDRLQKHLRPLERQGLDVWDDTRLQPGSLWREEIREALATTKVAILLISADFLASDFIVTDELPPLLKAAEENGATILPVIISHSRFERMESLSRFQAVNDPQKPLMQIRRVNQERVFDQVARAVEDALKR